MTSTSEALTPETLRAFAGAKGPAAVAELSAVRGSSPRGAGTFMLVGPAETLGTIGGGALEYLIIEHARRLLAQNGTTETMDVPLGPEIGQCCGGRVTVSLARLTPDRIAALATRLETEARGRPLVLVCGSGHVGRALAVCLKLLPVGTLVIDTRAEELALLPADVRQHHTAMPEAEVRAAPEGTHVVIVTHDHALDFLVAFEALKRADLGYVGMVGSRTKRARFSSWFLEEGGDRSDLARLVMPIGSGAPSDKRPEVIAALTAAEIMVHTASGGQPTGQRVRELAHGC